MKKITTVFHKIIFPYKKTPFVFEDGYSSAEDEDKTIRYIYNNPDLFPLVIMWKSFEPECMINEYKCVSYEEYEKYCSTLEYKKEFNNLINGN